MVNLGRPSRACLRCRTRKLRCDLRPGCCGQCRRAGLSCHGYRNPGDLVFCDETRSVQQKAAARQSWGQVLPQPSALELGLDTRARNVFFSIYIFRFTHSLGTVASLYSKAPAFDYLAASVEATSLAFLATNFNSLGLMRLANASYITAIRRLNYALTGLRRGDAEEALQSILLLDTYEKMVNRNPKGLASWMLHVQGAMSLLNIYGSEVTLSDTGRDLCARLVTSLIVSCAAAVVRVPDTLTTLRNCLDPFFNTVKWKFTGILTSIVNLQADLHQAGGRCTVDLAKGAEELDTQLIMLQETMPLPWRARKISPTSDHPLIFGSYYDIFADHYITQVINGIRAMRLILHSIISRHTPSNTPSNTPDLIRSITHQICAAVPQYILPGLQTELVVPFSPLQKLQCCTLLAPLYIANQVSEDVFMKDWIMHCLKFMSEEGGMKMAQDMADLIGTDPDLDYWLVYAKVGSYAFGA